MTGMPPTLADVVAALPVSAGGVRVDHLVTSGTFSLDGGTWEVDNNVWILGDDTHSTGPDSFRLEPGGPCRPSVRRESRPHDSPIEQRLSPHAHCAKSFGVQREAPLWIDPKRRYAPHSKALRARGQACVASSFARIRGAARGSNAG